jgi:hypothetical protein
MTKSVSSQPGSAESFSMKRWISNETCAIASR